MSYKQHQNNFYHTIYKNNHKHINEDLLDDISLDDVEDSSVTSRLSDNNDVLFDKNNYKHNLTIKCNRKVLISRNASESVLKIYQYLVERFVIPNLQLLYYIDDFQAGWEYSETDYLFDTTGFTPIDKTYEFFKNINNTFNITVVFKIYFNVNRKLDLNKILRTLMQFWSINIVLFRFDEYVAFEKCYFLDNYVGASFDSNIYNAIKYKAFNKLKDEQTLKHFISSFNNSREIKQEFKQKFTTTREINNFLNSGNPRSSFMSIFMNQNDFCDNSKTSVECIERTPILKIVRFKILKGASVRVSYHWTQPDVEFLVDGTLEFYNTFISRDIYHSNISYGIERLDKHYEHNEVVILPDFRCFPRKKEAVTIDLYKTNIKLLIVRASDRFIIDEEQLKNIINLTGTENVKEIKYEIFEDND